MKISTAAVQCLVDTGIFFFFFFTIIILIIIILHENCFSWTHSDEMQTGGCGLGCHANTNPSQDKDTPTYLLVDICDMPFPA